MVVDNVKIMMWASFAYFKGDRLLRLFTPFSWWLQYEALPSSVLVQWWEAILASVPCNLSTQTGLGTAKHKMWFREQQQYYCIVPIYLVCPLVWRIEHKKKKTSPSCNTASASGWGEQAEALVSRRAENASQERDEHADVPVGQSGWAAPMGAEQAAKKQQKNQSACSKQWRPAGLPP